MDLAAAIERNRARQSRFRRAETVLRRVRQRIFDYEDANLEAKAARVIKRCKAALTPLWVARAQRVDVVKLPRTGGRGQILVCFPEVPPPIVVDCLRNLLDGQGMKVEANGRAFKFWTTNGHVSDDKVNLAKLAIHRSGYARFDDAFDSPEDADDCFGIDANPLYSRLA